ncbi:MAG TPA: DNA repair protein RadC [Candidatus Faecisoma merdavium]|nr:DNA repair protein RadC [Candidatus Faecisoma merdavium]
MLIKDIPLNERPRERLINNGVEYLNNEELLSILLKCGTKDLSVRELASTILKQIDNINNLRDINYENLIKIKGIGKAKACEILASIELGKRINKINNINQIKIYSSESIFNYYKDKLSDKLQEYFYCVYLDTKNHIIKDKLLFIGTINQSLVHPREVFKEAYLLSATSIICIHNHPSGNVNPSNNDIIITKQLKEVGKLLGINVIDHIIIGKDSYYSFNDNGL